MQLAAKSPIAVRLILWGTALALALIAPVKAGTVTLLSKPTSFQGSLTLSPTGIQVQGAPSTEIPLADVLEANFSDALQLNYFSSVGDSSTVLPPDWKGGDLVKTVAPGSASYANGELTVSSPQLNPGDGIDGRAPCFVFGLPWRGDGEWSFRIKSADVSAGFLVADKFPLNGYLGISNWDSNWDQVFLRDLRGSTCCDRFTTQGVFPVWYRMTRQGSSFTFQSSKDGAKWDFCVQKLVDLPADLQAVFFTNGHTGKDGGKVVFDQMTFTPASGETSAPGVLLRSGSFLTGSFQSLDFRNSAPVGQFSRGGQIMPVAAAQIAEVVFHSEMREQAKEADGKVGIILKNGDFVEGAFQGIGGDIASLVSVIMGTETYNAEQMGACLLNPPKPLSADYEIRLKDGSVLLAKGLESKDGKLVIDEISGVQIPVIPEDVAQIRAGSNRAQSLTLLNWKPTSAPDASKPAPAVCWTGGTQERIMAITPGASIDFPLPEQYRTLSFGLALPPQSPANAQATLRVLADGKEILKTSPIRSGDAPRFTEVALPANKTLTLVAESDSPSVRVLVVDPTVLREAAL